MAKPKRAAEMGANGERVAANIADLRRQRNLEQAELADRMTRLGRPMSAPIVSKTEKLDRRVDVDDLVAFTVALDVTPNRLLLPGNASDGESVELSPEVEVSALHAWRWATGDAPLPPGCVPFDLIRDDRERRFARENRPHNIPESYFHNVEHPDPDLVRMIATVVTKARENGLDLGRLLSLVERVDRWRLFGQLDQEIAKLYESEG